VLEGLQVEDVNPVVSGPDEHPVIVDRERGDRVPRPLVEGGSRVSDPRPLLNGRPHHRLVSHPGVEKMVDGLETHHPALELKGAKEGATLPVPHPDRGVIGAGEEVVREGAKTPNRVRMTLHFTYVRNFTPYF